MSYPKQKRLILPDYIDWIKTLPCVICGEPGYGPHHIVPHHLIGIGGIAMGMGTKAGDEWAMPMHKLCHRLWHDNPDYEAQWEWVARTLTKAIEAGILEVTDGSN